MILVPGKNLFVPFVTWSNYWKYCWNYYWLVTIKTITNHPNCYWFPVFGKRLSVSSVNLIELLKLSLELLLELTIHTIRTITKTIPLLLISCIWKETVCFFLNLTELLEVLLVQLLTVTIRTITNYPNCYWLLVFGKRLSIPLLTWPNY